MNSTYDSSTRTTTVPTSETVDFLGTVKLSGVALPAARINELPVHPAGSTAASKLVTGNTCTVQAGDDTAGSKTIATGLTTIAAVVVQVVRSGAVVTGDAAVSFSAGNLVIADGSTYALTMGDVVNWIAFGV